MPTASGYVIVIDGADVSANFGPVLLEIEIEDSDGGKSDKLSIKLDDAEGQIAFPRSGADIMAQIYSLDDGSAVTFVGKTDEPKSSGDRESGMIMTITAHSADMAGEGKHKKHAYKDGGSFNDAASEFGQAAGFQVTCDDDVGGVTRDYWSMSNESFFSWGERMAREIGATFKVRGTQAVFVSRDGSASAAGQALAGVTATYGDNLISWDMAPVMSRPQFETSKVRWFDPKAAQWNEEEEQIDTSNGD